jgi:hypothetical protein
VSPVSHRLLLIDDNEAPPGMVAVARGEKGYAVTVTER